MKPICRLDVRQHSRQSSGNLQCAVSSSYVAGSRYGTDKYPIPVKSAFKTADESTNLWLFIMSFSKGLRMIYMTCVQIIEITYYLLPIHDHVPAFTPQPPVHVCTLYIMGRILSRCFVEAKVSSLLKITNPPTTN